MVSLFKKKPTACEQAKDAQKEIKSTILSNQHQMDHDIRNLDHQEKQPLQQIKQRAQTAGVNPQIDSALKAKAQQLVQLLNQKEKLFEAKAQLSSMGMQGTVMAS